MNTINNCYIIYEVNANEIIYHKATPEDAILLADYRIRFATELSGPQSEETVVALHNQLKKYFKDAAAKNLCVSFIAKCDGKVAGIGSMVYREMPGGFKIVSGKWGYIMNMYTLPEFRRRGICRSILNLLVEEGKKNGVGAFELHATSEGEFVYKQSGFLKHSEPTYRMFEAAK